jgi:hypothetical protein
MLKSLSVAAAAASLAVGSYGLHQYHAIDVELNQAQAQVRVERQRNADLSTAAANVVTAVSQLQEALARDEDKLSPAEQGGELPAALPTVAQER